MSLVLFWTAVASIIYSYLLFPVLVFLRGIFAPRPHLEADVQPTVSIIVAAHDEAPVIGRKIESVLALDYPKECLELVVASDGSRDGTNEIVAEYAQGTRPSEWLGSGGVRLLALPRVGKAAALNAAASAAEGEILVFSDANSIFSPGSLRALLRPFADPSVGGVAGNQCYVSDNGNAADTATTTGNAGERLYWAFDRKLKVYESRAGNTISATGALYALRRSLFHGIPDGVTDDFYNSVGVVAQGRRLVFAPEAVVHEKVAATGRTEFQRKVRVMTRGLAAVAARRELLNPSRYGWYSWQVLSHKVLRRLVIFPLLILAVVSPRLWRRGALYKMATAGQAALYGAAVTGSLIERRGTRVPRVLAFPYYFVLVNLASLIAAINLIRGRRIARW